MNGPGALAQSRQVSGSLEEHLLHVTHTLGWVLWGRKAGDAILGIRASASSRAEDICSKRELRQSGTGWRPSRDSPARHMRQA